MAAPADSELKRYSTGAPESPTTAQPFDMDDDDSQSNGGLASKRNSTIGGPTSAPGSNTGFNDAPPKPDTSSPLPPPAASPNASATPTASSPQTTGNAAAPEPEEAAPPKPPRPVSERQRNEQILKEAFPSIEDGIIKAVLSASAGRIEPAFNALLEMTDPEAAKTNELPPPPQPPRPVQPRGPPSGFPGHPGSTPQSQLDADEQYARQLAQHYDSVGAYEARTSSLGPGSVPRGPGREQARRRHRDDELYGYDDHEPEPNFIDDELPIIRENLRKGFLETQTKVNTWFTNFKKRIDESLEEQAGDDDDDDDHPRHDGRYGRQAGASSGPGRLGRQSGDYDADPQVLGDDFAGMKLNPDGSPATSQRASHDANVFRPPPASSSSRSPRPEGRRVAFQEGVEEITPRPPPKDVQTPRTAGGGPKASKWQPLSTVEPNPIADNDPFSLGDSDDERDVKDRPASRGDTRENNDHGDIKKEDSDRLRQAAAEAMSDSLVAEDKDKDKDKAITDTEGSK